MVFGITVQTKVGFQVGAQVNFLQSRGLFITAQSTFVHHRPLHLRIKLKCKIFFG